MNRYSGKPLLRLAECYVLDRIDQLAFGQREVLERIEPKLKLIYNSSGSWQDIVASQLELEDTFDSKVRALWDRFLEQARASNSSADPNECAISFVDQNFGSTS